MRLFKTLFSEKCPECQKTLVTDKTAFMNSIVKKSCPDNHYQKEYHPALETYVESNHVS
ncbi:hypothetical protein ACTQ5K_18325 [Niallia sp. Sow4_A1]|uniref:hypothetical protein n=1 Tax=Bacillaceae TaxID=186817 RepID=UPI001F473F44|nr:MULTISPECIES: hypothetical protein [Bacillaceae]MCF2646474.1 hypothetical protein [Niallia circulans]CAI9390645.1 hypothetical protein BACSP_00392 [Bacillus sp. T2.9-1]